MQGSHTKVWRGFDTEIVRQRDLRFDVQTSVQLGIREPFPSSHGRKQQLVHNSIHKFFELTNSSVAVLFKVGINGEIFSQLLDVQRLITDEKL